MGEAGVAGPHGIPYGSHNRKNPNSEGKTARAYRIAKPLPVISSINTYHKIELDLRHHHMTYDERNADYIERECYMTGILEDQAVGVICEER